MATPSRGLEADPAYRTARARKAAEASHSNAAIIRRFMARLPELTDEQLETVRRALPPVTHERGDDAT